MYINYLKLNIIFVEISQKPLQNFNTNYFEVTKFKKTTKLGKKCEYRVDTKQKQMTQS